MRAPVSHENRLSLLKRAAMLIVVALLVLGQATVGMAADPGVIRGKVINGTSGEAVAGLTVKLEKIKDNQPAGTASSVSSASGEFKFDGLDTQAGYVLTVNYKDVTYDSPGLIFDKDKTGMDVDISVFEPGAGAASIVSKRGHTILFPETGGISVLEYGSLFNIDKKVFMPGTSGSQGTLDLFLPKEAESISYVAGLTDSNVTRSENGLRYTAPVKPGQIDLAYGYRIPLSGNSSYIYVRPIIYQTQGYSLLVRGDNVKIESSMLERQQPVTMNNETYQLFAAPELAPGTNVMISMTLGPGGVAGAPAPLASGGPTSTGLSPAFVGVVSAVVVVALASVVFFFMKRRKAPAPVAAQADPVIEDELLEELASLDDSFEAGQIPEETYRQIRAEKKAQLLRLMQSKG